MPDELGPFQGVWDAWVEVQEQIERKPISHFEQAVQIQFSELREHLEAGDREAAAREMVDVVSIALNTLRKLGFSPTEIAEIAQNRAKDRMLGQAEKILDKYESVHQI
ncbi:hypothetical protein ACKI1I_33310 [Streptomyces turgidiscabies]|uniref:MazG nucleotide pyrophosphohydrolase domain protein n=1 Tax=Streptomyces turgidiscabies (strain Car8) TaxID=698760 RepID=L7FAW9_STRT8|nr:MULTISPECIES: hypothetical protein [Streptomyces]ELP68708.1 hypothetical protein STRTUCAR8_03824 [Streptomyces turgidiscabies Car8]MDX3497076.1 hypothetical protein [Streptomyces turgidiscabies]GAQ68776.1 hypothetical protein T45_00491 [Streptomyces turgidiscabies]